MEPIAGKFFGIKPNEMELAISPGKPTETETQVELACEALLAGRNLHRVSRGSRGCYYADASGARMFRALRPRGAHGERHGRGRRVSGGVCARTDRRVPLERQLD